MIYNCDLKYTREKKASEAGGARVQNRGRETGARVTGARVTGGFLFGFRFWLFLVGFSLVIVSSGSLGLLDGRLQFIHRLLGSIVDCDIQLPELVK